MSGLIEQRQSEQPTNGNGESAGESRPEYVEKIERHPRMVSRVISDSESLKFSFEYFFLTERLRWLQDEQKRLKKKFVELNRDIQLEMAEVNKECERLRLGIRYRIIEESPPPVITQERAQAKTSLNLNEPK